MASFHETETFSASIPAGQQTSGVIEVHGFENTVFHLGATFTGTEVNFQGAVSRGGTYASVYGTDGVLVTNTVTVSAWHPFPTEVKGLHSVKIVAVSTQSTSAAETITVSGQIG